MMTRLQMLEAIESRRRLVELRASRRVELGVDVCMDDNENLYLGYGENISEGGMFVVTYMFVAAYELKALGTELRLTFRLPDGRTIDAAGKVRWIRDPRQGEDSNRPPGMGIEFTHLDQEDLAAIREHVAQREPLSFVKGR